MPARRRRARPGAGFDRRGRPRAHRPNPRRGRCAAYHGAPKAGRGRDGSLRLRGSATEGFYTVRFSASTGGGEDIVTGRAKGRALGGAMQHARNSTGALARGPSPPARGRRARVPPEPTRCSRPCGASDGWSASGQVKDGPGTKFLGTPANHRGAFLRRARVGFPRDGARKRIARREGAATRKRRARAPPR